MQQELLKQTKGKLVSTAKIRDIISRSIDVKRQMLDGHHIVDGIEAIVRVITNCYKKGGKVFFCGNGGSVADAQHLAAELSGRFKLDRKPLAAEAFVNVSSITAIANDFGFNEVFSRQIEGNGKKGDVLVAISTSGCSGNIIAVLKKARSMGIATVGLTGMNGKEMNSHCDHLIFIPSDVTARIQEGHILVGHIICELVEERLFVSGGHSGGGHKTK